ncbi:acid-sensing ion channel 1B-like [Glandiceps talaboti]
MDVFSTLLTRDDVSERPPDDFQPRAQLKHLYSKGCSFAGNPCGPQNFSQVVTNYGICYTFNSGDTSEIVKVVNAGQRPGLQLLLNVDASEYGGPRQNTGFRLMVHDQKELPDVAGQGISIAPGTDTTIGLTKSVLTTQLTNSNSDKDAQLTQYRYTDKKDKNYEQSRADYRTYFRVQVIELIRNTYSYITVNGTGILDIIPSDCYENVPGIVFENLYFEILELIMTRLLSNAFDVLYSGNYDGIGSDIYDETFENVIELIDSSITMVTFEIEYLCLLTSEDTNEEIVINPNFTRHFHRPAFEQLYPILYQEEMDYRTNLSNQVLENVDVYGICKEFMEDNLSKVTVYFEDLKVESIIQQPEYKSFSLVCDIGGSLGLFFGASIVTFLEILDFFMVNFWKRCFTKTQTSVTQINIKSLR